MRAADVFTVNHLRVGGAGVGLGGDGRRAAVDETHLTAPSDGAPGTRWRGMADGGFVTESKHPPLGTFFF